MLKIKQSENGYWISENWTYLDTYKATIYKRKLHSKIKSKRNNTKIL